MTTKIQYCAFVRHSERSDQVLTENLQNEEKVDPQITSNGIRMAQETGEFIKKQMEEKNIEKIKIYSSPFLRSMQTAAQVAKVLGIETIEIEYMVSEVLYTYLFEESPFSKLLINTKSHDYISKKYLDGISFINSS